MAPYVSRMSEIYAKSDKLLIDRYKVNRMYAKWYDIAEKHLPQAPVKAKQHYAELMTHDELFRPGPLFAEPAPMYREYVEVKGLLFKNHALLQECGAAYIKETILRKQVEAQWKKENSENSNIIQLYKNLTESQYELIANLKSNLEPQTAKIGQVQGATEEQLVESLASLVNNFTQKRMDEQKEDSMLMEIRLNNLQHENLELIQVKQENEDLRKKITLLENDLKRKDERSAVADERSSAKIIELNKRATKSDSELATAKKYIAELESQLGVEGGLKRSAQKANLGMQSSGENAKRARKVKQEELH